MSRVSLDARWAHGKAARPVHTRPARGPGGVRGYRILAPPACDRAGVGVGPAAVGRSPRAGMGMAPPDLGSVAEAAARAASRSRAPFAPGHALDAAGTARPDPGRSRDGSAGDARDATPRALRAPGRRPGRHDAGRPARAECRSVPAHAAAPGR